MKVYEYGDPDSDIVLVQLTGEHELDSIQKEIEEIKRNTDRSFRMLAIMVTNWNRDLSPWEASAVFGKENFGGGAADTLVKVLELCADREKTYYIGGYSLAGLFALWAAYQTDRFEGVAAASPSIWFPGFVEYMQENRLKSSAVYLSLGDKEERTKNPIMRTVSERIRDANEHLKHQGIRCVLEWNTGNHFQDADKRTARAFAWLLQTEK